VTFIQVLIVAVQPSPPVPKAASRSSHPMVSRQHNPIGAVIAPMQKISVGFGQLVKHVILSSAIPNLAKGSRSLHYQGVSVKV
jgi:hypothetical protein